MTDSDLAERLDAVERALTDDGTDLTDVRDAAALASDLERLEARVDDLEAIVDELEAAVEAVRGYAGNVRAVNRDVERRASAALAKAEALESAVDADRDATRSPPDSPSRSTPDDRAATAGSGPEPDRNSDAVVGPDADWHTPDRQATDRDPPDRSREQPPDPAGGAGDPSDDDSGGTEQFIQRVRDAL